LIRPHLDPTKTPGANTATTVVERIPARVREFGFYPDTGQMQPGDLVLVCPLPPTPNATVIRRIQSSSHGEFEARWIHAAAFLGDDSLVEIDQGGVGVVDLSKYVGRHLIHVRRPLDLNGHPVYLLTGYRIAVSALKMFRTSYGFLDLIEIGRQAIGVTSNQLSRRSKAAICSDYYNDAVARVLGRGAVSAKINPFTPADLSASTNMTDVQVDWLALQA
jgi:hypothetical protein